MRWTRRPGGALTIAATLGLVGAGAQAIFTRWERRRYPPPGELVDAGGHRLHLLRAGAGTPVVVLDAGLGGFSVDWSLVMPGVAAYTTVCAYDRAGYGWSDPGPGPRTSWRIAEELHAALRAAGLPGPYVLVGHSFGGFNVRLFADRFPEEAAGLVMVDASHEDEVARLPDHLRAAYRRLARLELLAWQVGRACSAVGLVRLAGAAAHLAGALGLPPIAAFAKLPPAQRRLARLLRYRPGYYAACYAEDRVFPESAAQARGARAPRAIPVAVVVATGGAGIAAGAAPLPGPARQVARALWAQKQELARALARQLSPAARYIVAERSGHLIPLDQPEVVVDAIRQVVEAARRQAR